MKSIKIPHLGYTVRYGKPDKKISRVMDNNSWGMCCRKDSSSQSTIYWRDNPQLKDMPTVAHEVIHVLQNLCESCSMDFDSEKEHIAYLMQYCLNEIFGYEYFRNFENTKKRK